MSLKIDRVFLPDLNIHKHFSKPVIVKDNSGSQDVEPAQSQFEFIQRMPYPPPGGKTLCKLVERALPKNAGRLNYVVIIFWIFIGISLEYVHELLESLRPMNKMGRIVGLRHQK